MATYTQVKNNLEKLKLSQVNEYLPSYLNTNERSDSNYLIDALKELTDKEIAFREERAKLINIKISNFPFIKPLDTFDFSYQPSIDKSKILELSTLDFVNKAENVILIGSPGVGKSHLSVSLGLEATTNRLSTYFIHFNTLMNKMNKAVKENRTENVIKQYSRTKLLIIDELGYQQIDKESAKLFFQLIAARYEKKSIIITTNQPLSKWGEVFGDSVIANAIIDRLVHHSHIIKITGPSYRIKGKAIYETEEEK